MCFLWGTNQSFILHAIWIDGTRRRFPLSDTSVFPLSVSFHQCPILTFIYTLLVPEGRTVEAWERLRKAELFPISAEHRTQTAFIVSVFRGWKFWVILLWVTTFWMCNALNAIYIRKVSARRDIQVEININLSGRSNLFYAVYQVWKYYLKGPMEILFYLSTIGCTFPVRSCTVMRRITTLGQRRTAYTTVVP